MKHRTRRIAAAILALTLMAVLSASSLAGESGAYDFSNGLDSAVGAYLASHSTLNENSFSMGFYNTVTGESWYYNPDTYFVGGSVYKLPLCMLYADMLAEGTRQNSDRVGNYTISYAMQLAMVNSSNEAADALVDGLHLDYRTYRQQAAGYSGLDIDSIPESYYTDNTYSPRFMIGVLQRLYENSEHYNEILFWMTQANPNEYFRLNPSPYTIAQKYGSYTHCDAAVGIVYAPQPYLLAVFINGHYDQPAISDMVSLTSAYIEQSMPTPSPEPSPDAVTLRDIPVAGGVSLEIDGEAFVPKNAAGEEVDVFVYDGTTYLPLRALAEALGYDVAWDGDTRTVSLSSPGGAAEETPPDE